MLVDGKVLDQKGKQNVKQFNYDLLRNKIKSWLVLKKDDLSEI